ncbi:Radical SAM domain protein [Thermaerobacter marianensis DSM 12885]|uniref:Radical SAM domain protein n=1 Tax=Thermaerobacter marianensis (strain ATCC 700841 / DSM 12885 / JCM 10246 / 7p75a) TaxID=644966 RepID=E6SGG4_THEM7|nr:radical SAM protein [Thermaerobacter marianensis]ADU51616.1 Radical SAM domain protein [Thermaerobacter marianensis DSM 12885]
MTDGAVSAPAPAPAHDPGPAHDDSSPRSAPRHRPLSDFDRAPVILIWETTRACDLVCAHCRASAQPDRHPLELRTEEAHRLIDEAADMGTRLFVFTGGDPLKRPDLMDLIRHAADRGLHPSVTPSATPLLTADRIRAMAAAGAEAVALSLDGDEPALHDAFRGWTGSFARTLAAARAVRQAGLRLQINTTVTRLNWRRLDRIARLVADLGAGRWSVFFLVPTGRGAALKPLTAAEHEAVYHWLADLEGRVPFAIKTTEAPAYRRVLVQHGRPLRPAIGDGKSFCFVSHTGAVYPSGFLPLAAGNVRMAPLARTYRESPLFRALRDPAQLKGKCGRCPFKALCGGSRARAYAMTGDPLAEEPTCAYEPDGSGRAARSARWGDAGPGVAT